MMRRLINEIDPSVLCGRICVVPVCNPLAMSRFNRQTPEQHGKTDLHEVFPGNPRGNLTQMIAHAITSKLIDHVDVLIDYHCGGSGGRLQERVDVHRDAPHAIKEKSLQLARHFGVVLVHENDLTGSAVGYANSQGKIAFNAETGGVYLGQKHMQGYLDRGDIGLRNVLKQLGMLTGPAAKLPRQLYFSSQQRKEVNPSRAGYLESCFQHPEDLGKPIAKGTKLGELIDMYSFEVIEQMISPVDAFLMFSRYSGIVDAGTKAFALVEEAGSRWLE